MRHFETVFLEDAAAFLETLDAKTVRKVLYNIDLAEQMNDPRLFKKLQNDIWEFRASSAGLQIRMTAFWDKSDNRRTLVIVTHGFVKKVDKVPLKEIEKAERIRKTHFDAKRKK